MERKENSKNLIENSFEVLRDLMEDGNEENQQSMRSLGDSEDHQRSIVREKECVEDAEVKFKERFRNRKVPFDETEISKKNKGKIGVNGKNSQSVVIRKQVAGLSQKVSNMERLNTGVMSEQILRDCVSKVAANADTHVLVRGNNTSNIITRTTIPNTIPMVEILGPSDTSMERARQETFNDPSVPHPSKPNEISGMDLTLPTGDVHNNHVFDESVSVLRGTSHIQPLGEVETPTSVPSQ